MIWLTWRQARAQAVTAGAALAVFAILLAVTGPHLASLYSASGINACHGSGCVTAAGHYLDQLTSIYSNVYEVGIGVILVAPAIIGIFWGAPLIAREIEGRTFAVAWTQSVTRIRWLVAKLALTGLAAMAVCEALCLLYGWWVDPISKAIGLGGNETWEFPNAFRWHAFSLVIFASHGITPLGYAAFAFALGTAAGVLFRRALPAMAITLAIFAAVQVAVPLWVRPYLLPPDRTVVSGPSWFVAAGASMGTLQASTVPRQPGAWIISSGAINAAGRRISSIPAACMTPTIGKGGSTDAGPCMARRGIREAITYQPADRYWRFQWMETEIYTALALALAGFCFWRLGRRRT